jgi:hypothetical protein
MYAQRSVAHLLALRRDGTYILICIHIYNAYVNIDVYLSICVYTYIRTYTDIFL